MPKFLVIQKQGPMPIPMEALKKLIPAQFAFMNGLQKSGKMEAGYGLATEKGGCLILNVSSHEELQQIIDSNPMWPFSTMETYALVSLEAAEKNISAMVAKLP